MPKVAAYTQLQNPSGLVSIRPIKFFAERKQPVEHHTINEVNCQQVSNTNEYKKNIQGNGRQYRQMVQKYQQKIAKNFWDFIVYGS